MSIDIAIKDVQKALDALKALLLQEEILTEDESGELVSNQSQTSAEAIEAYKARQAFDIRL